jgi:hypothetical protein
LLAILAAAEGVYIEHRELPIPAIMYGAIAMVAFITLAFVTYSYRDVANRHDHKASSSKGH